MTQKRFVRVCVCAAVLWAIIEQPCSVQAILIGTIATPKAELADDFLYSYSHSCMSTSSDWILAKVDNANHPPREIISQKSQIC